MTKTQAKKHYSEVNDKILISDYVWCLANTWRQAIAIYSSLMMVFDWTKMVVDKFYIKEKLAMSEDSTDIYFIILEIRKRISEGRFTQEFFDNQVKEEKKEWSAFKFTP